MIKLIAQNKIIKYLLTGGLTFVVDYMLLLTSYYVFSFPLWTSTTLGYLGGLCVSFFTNRAWVFEESGNQRRMTRQLLEYVSLLLFNYIFTVFSIRLADGIGVEPAISKIIITAMIAGWNYVIFNKIIFAQPKKKQTHN